MPLGSVVAALIVGDRFGKAARGVTVRRPPLHAWVGEGLKDPLILPADLASSVGDRAVEKHWLRLLGPAGAKFIGCGPSGGSGLLKSVFPLGVVPSVACVIV